MSKAKRIWFITGISRGFGRALAEALVARAQPVIGTTRDGRAPFEAPADALAVLPLEVTDRGQVQAAVAKAHAVHGRLDVIVNNAGYGLVCPLEEAPEEAVRHIFEVNVFGPLRVMQAALPLLRAQRSGHIVNFSSIAGLAPGAGAAIYAATKMALEGMSLSLAQEVQPLGLKVTLVEPGFFRTDFLKPNSIRMTGSTIADYEATAGRNAAAMAASDGKQPGDPARAAEAVIRAVEAEEPPLQLVLGADALARARARLAKLNADMAAWEAVASATAFDPA